MSVTIKDIAQVAGVSYSTVSKALNNSPLVKKDTKDKIITIANQLGYEPNYAAQQLVSKKTKVIGLIWPTVQRVVLATLVTKISEEMNQTPYSMILSVDPVDKAIETFKRFQVDAMILFEEHSGAPINRQGIPLLSYGVSGKATHDYPMIDANHEQAMHEAIQYLYTLGHRKIAYIGDISPFDPLQIEKYNGFQHAMNHFNLSVSSQNVVNTAGLDWYDGYTAAKKLMQQSYRPTAIVGGSYDISGGIVRGIKELGLNIPKDISIISYDNIPQMENMEVPLTSIGVPIEELASEIVHSAIQLIESEDTTPFVKMLRPELKERTSCATATALI